MGIRIDTVVPGNLVSHAHTVDDFATTGTPSNTTYLRGDGAWATPTASAAWGSITGTLSSQTDLQSALDGKVDENAAITGATKTKITYDAKGLVSSGADATTADIADSTNKRYVTDAQLTVIGNTSGTNSGDSASIPIGYLDTDGTLAANSDTRVASQKATKTYADQLIASANALVYKGTIDCSANPNYPAADAGHLYVVSVAGKIGGASGTTVEVGDMAICNTDATASGTQATVGTYWNIIEKNIAGAVVGAASSTDGNMALFDGTTGKVIKNGSPPPANTSAVSNNFITAYNSSTGAFSQARPTWANIDKTTSSLADITTKTHSLLSSLTADDHTQYALLAGRSGGQTLIGGTSASNSLTLNSTSNATKGGIKMATATGDWVEMGTNPAQSGILRLPNNQYIYARNAANTADIPMIWVNSSNKVNLGTGLDLGNQAITGVYSISQFDPARWELTNTGDFLLSGYASIGGSYAGLGNVPRTYIKGTGDTSLTNPLYIVNSIGNETFTLDDSGTVYIRNNLGVGVASTLGRVHIKGTGNTSATTSLYIENSSGVETFSVNDAAQLMIGSGTPAHNISFQNDGNKTIAILSTAAGTAGRIMTLAAGSTTAGTADIAGGNLQLQAGIGTGSGSGGSNILFRTATPGTAGTTTLQTVSAKGIITGGGDWGIGTTAPLTRLHVSDNDVTNGAYIYLERNDTALASGEVLGRIAWATNDTDVTTNRLGGEIVVQAVNGGASDAFSTRMIFKTLPNIAASAMVEAFRITETQDIQIADTANIIVGTTTGTKIGTSTTQKLGFYNATPIVRPGAYTQTYSTADKTIANISIQTLTAASGTGDTTVADVGTAFNQTTLNNNFKDLANQINNAVTDITDLKQAVNAIIDDLQNLGLVG